MSDEKENKEEEVEESFGKWITSPHMLVGLSALPGLFSRGGKGDRKRIRRNVYAV